MSRTKIIIGCKAPLFSPRCYSWNENGCTKPQDQCVYQYDYQEFIRDSSEDTRIYKGDEKNGVCPWLGLCDLAIESNYEYCYGRHTECPTWNEDPYFNTSKECVTK